MWSINPRRKPPSCIFLAYAMPRLSATDYEVLERFTISWSHAGPRSSGRTRACPKRPGRAAILDDMRAVSPHSSRTCDTYSQEPVLARRRGRPGRGIPTPPLARHPSKEGIKKALLLGTCAAYCGVSLPGAGPAAPASSRSPARCLGARPSWPLAGWKPALLGACHRPARHRGAGGRRVMQYASLLKGERDPRHRSVPCSSVPSLFRYSPAEDRGPRRLRGAS